MSGHKLHAAITGLPVPQGSKRVVGGILLDSNRERLRPWRDSVAYQVGQAVPHDWPYDWAYRVRLSFTFVRPKSHLKRDGSLTASAPWYKSSRPDLDKLVRAVLDSCTDAGVWHDDCQVVGLDAVKLYGTASGVVIDVQAVPDTLAQGREAQ